MKPNLQRLMKQLTQAADALRFADAGELMPLEDKTSLLGVAPAKAPPHSKRAESAPSPRRRVALAAERQLGDAVLRYALNVCERLDADLEVLVGPGLADAQQQIDLARHNHPLSYRIQRLGQDFLGDVARYAWTTNGLLFVVAGAGDGLAERAVDGDGGRLGIPSQVPWVVVAEERAAA